VNPVRAALLLVLGTLAATSVARIGATDSVARVAAADSAARTGAAERSAALALDATAIPDDAVLLEQLEDAIELRRREDFDRVLDARDPGELVEHATLTEVDFDHRTLGIDTLFIVGDELFGFLFRPENGWGGKDDRIGDEAMPRLTRVHDGLTGGPDAFGCFSCHFKGGPDGAGTQSQNIFLTGDGETLESADQRNPPHLLGLGPISLLAREMTADLLAQAQATSDRAEAEGRSVQATLVTKGVTFGRIAAAPDGTLDTSGVEGVDADLTVRPFGWKGHQATIRDMAEESFHIHQGLLSKRVQLGIQDGSVDAAPYGEGAWDDVDQDGVSLEIDSGMLTTMVGYLAQLEAPIVRPPNDPSLLDRFARGREVFEDVGCASCHVPTLELTDSRFEAVDPPVPGREPFVIDVAKDGEHPKIEPKYARKQTAYLVHLFSDLKRHDMGAELASPRPQGSIPASVFLTRPLWGLAETAPYLHDGRAPTVHEAIAYHGGEAAGARDAYLKLDEDARASLRVFLTSLSRQPKLFVP
jgi:hypothetical protein